MAKHGSPVEPATPSGRRVLRGPRLGLLIGTAVLGAVGFGVISPAAPTTSITARADVATMADVLAERSGAQHASRDAASIDASAIQALNDPASEKSDQRAQGASAIAQGQERAQALAAAAARRAAEAAAASAQAQQAGDTGGAGRDAYRAYARGKVSAAEFGCLDLLWERESNWRPFAQNPTSTAYGIAQLLDTTWEVTGYTKTTNGYTQVDAGLAYLRAAYPGGICSAWAHETAYSWY